MSYLAVLSFDLANASREDYENAYADLARLGLHRHLPADIGGQVMLPTTTCAGTFDGSTARSVADDLMRKVKEAFTRRRFSSEIFLSAAGNWAWGKDVT